MPDQAPNEAELFAEALEDVHRAIVEQSLAESIPSEDEEGEVSERIQRAANCLRRIERARRSAAASGESAETPVSVEQTLVSPENFPTGSIGPFEIVSQIGEGGYGLVFEANDRRLNRRVALKVPRANTLLTPGLRERFLREAEVAAGLDHPNIVSVYESGSLGSICYIATALVRGQSLSNWLRTRTAPLASRAAAKLLKTLADAVHHAHTRGVLHRDIKPSNVLLETGRNVASAPDSSDQQACELPDESLAEVIRLTDFGLARIIDTPEATRSGSILGTPYYMSPEQAEGNRSEVGVGSDIFSLGVILYELLAGCRPFDQDSILDTLASVRRCMPIPIRRHRPDLERDMEAIVSTCLQKHPGQRYSSCAELAADLKRFLNGEPVAARHTTALERSIRWCQRRPFQTALAATLLLGVSLVATVSTFAYIKVASARDLLDDKNTQLTDTNSALRESRKASDRRLSRLRETLDAQLSVVIKEHLGRQDELTPEHREYLQAALASYRQFATEEGNDRTSREGVARAFESIGDIERRMGTNGAADRSFQKSLEHYDSLVEQFNDPDLRFHRLRLLTKRYELLGQLEQLDEAMVLADEALQANRDLVDEFPEKPMYRSYLASSYSSMGNLLKAAGRLRQAEEATERSLVLKEQLVADFPNNPNHLEQLSKACGSLAQLRIRQRRLDDAMALMHKATDIQQRLVNDNPQKRTYREVLALHLNLVGIIHTRAGRLKEAEESFRRFLKVQEGLVLDHPAYDAYKTQLVGAYNNLGKIMIQTLRTEDAERYYKTAERTARRLVEDAPEVAFNHYQLATVLLQLSQIELLNGNVATGMSLALEGDSQLKIALQTNEDNPRYRVTLSQKYQVLAQAYSHNGNHVEAAREAELLLKSPFHPRESPYAAAGVFARCALLASGAQEVTPEDRHQLEKHYADRAIASLQQAIERGFSDARRLAHPDFQRLMHRDDMKNLVKRLSPR